MKWNLDKGKKLEYVSFYVDKNMIKKAPKTRKYVEYNREHPPIPNKVVD